MSTSEKINAKQWIPDGSKDGTLETRPSSTSTDVLSPNPTASSSTISFASASQGTPFNIRLDCEQPIQDDFYYQVTVTEISKGGNLAVGLVTQDEFRPGWKTSGCFYNGNITNGSAGLIIGFGDKIEKGDDVGVLLRRISAGGDGGKYDIIFYHNGRCLGCGFSLTDVGDGFYPCLHLTGKATVEFSLSDSNPSVFEREPEIFPTDDCYSGDWIISKAFTGAELHELPLPPGHKFIVSFSKDTSQSEKDRIVYTISAKIGNRLSTSLAITGKMESFDKIDILCPLFSTRMMPPPEVWEVERFISKALDADDSECEGQNNGFTKMIVSENGELIMSGGSAEIICSRFFEKFQPIESYSR